MFINCNQLQSQLTASYPCHRLCAQALTPAAVSDEPLIQSGRDLRVRVNSESTEVPPENPGDVAAHGFWRRGATTIFDARITDTDAPTYRNRDAVKVLAAHEKEKKDKYLEECLARRLLIFKIFVWPYTCGRHVRRFRTTSHTHEYNFCTGLVGCGLPISRNCANRTSVVWQPQSGCQTF